MTFAAPMLLAALGLLLPVLVAFLVRRRRTVLRVPSTLLYRLAGVPAATNRRFRNLRRLVSLALCLLGVGALVVAAARPSLRARGETVAFVVDLSASMAAGGSDSPLARARRFAARRIASAGPGDRFAVVAAGAAPARLAGPVGPGAELDVALDGLAVETGAADMGAAVDLAASIVQSEPGARVIVLGDGGEPVPAQAAGLVQVSQRDFAPSSRDNLGIATLAARPSEARDDEREVLVIVATSSERARRARVTVSADGRPLAEKTVDVPAGGEVEVRARVVSAAAKVTARVAPADGVADALAADDVAELAGGAKAKLRALLVADPAEAQRAGAFFVEKALLAAGAAEVVHVTPNQTGLWPTADVMVVLGAAPAKKAELPALYVGTAGGALPVSRVHELEGSATHLRSLEPKDPLLRGVALDGVTIERATAMTPPAGARALVDLDGGTVVAAGGKGSHAWVYVGIDPAKSDLALRVAFPVLVANALAELGGAADVTTAPTIARSEIALAASDGPSADDEPSRKSLPLSLGLAVALAGAALLALEAWTFRKGWATG